MQRRQRSKGSGPMCALLTMLARVIFGAVAPALCSVALAQNYPDKPIRMIVPFPPGGANDIIGRLLAQKMSERLGQPTIVENRAGADGVIGTEIAVRAAPDGYTVIIVSTSFVQNAAIHKLSYDPVKSLTPIAMVGKGYIVIYAAPKFPAQNARDLIALAKVREGAIRYASSGIGGAPHFGGELFNLLAGVKMTHVPYKGGGPSMVDVIGGRVEVGVGTLTQILPHLRAGTLKVVAIGSTRRSAIIPDVPTVAESGVPGYDASVWWGIMGPAGIPGSIVAQINEAIGSVLKDSEMTKRLESEAAEVIIASPAATRNFVAEELDKWARVAKETGMRAE